MFNYANPGGRPSASTGNGGLFGGGGSSVGGSTASMDPNAKLLKQIGDYQTRLNSAGVQNPGDTRGWLAKTLNMPQGGNFLTDSLDLLERPFHGITGGIDAGINHQNVLNGAWNGLSGNTRIDGSQLLGDAGVTNPFLKTAGGIAADIVLDPATYLGGAAVKGAGLGLKALADGAEALAPGAVGAIKDSVKPISNAIGSAFNYTHNTTPDFVNAFHNINAEHAMNQTQNLQAISHMIKEGGFQRGEDITNLKETPQQVQAHNDQIDFLNSMKAPGTADIPHVQLPQPDEMTMRHSENLGNMINLQNQQLAQKNIGFNQDLNGDNHVFHVATQDYKNAKGLTNPTPAPKDNNIVGTNKPFNERTLDGSVSDINANSQAHNGIDTFEKNAYLNTALGLANRSNQAKSAELVRELFTNGAIPSNTVKDAAEHQALQDQGYKLITPDQYAIKGGDGSVKLNPGVSPGSYYVKGGNARLVDQELKNMSGNDNAKQLFQVFNKLTNGWKKTALLNPGFHLHNVMGNMFNQFIGGMNPLAIGKYTANATKDYALAQQAIKNQAIGKAVTDAQSQALERYNNFRRTGLSETTRLGNEFLQGTPRQQTLQKLGMQDPSLNATGLQKAGNAAKNAIGFLPNVSQHVGQTADEIQRLASYQHAIDQGMSHAEAANHVRKTLFDYSELTPFEQRLKSIFPFYTWMRKDVPYQVQGITQKPGVYANADKIRQELEQSNGMNDQTTPGYLKDNFGLAIPGTSDGKGGGKFLSTNLPMSDLNFFGDPAGQAISMLNPFLKVPAEESMNYNTYLKSPIEKFQGQTAPLFGKQIPIKDQYALTQLIPSVSRLNKSSQSMSSGNILGGLGGSIVKNVDGTKQQTSDLYNQLKALQDASKAYKQQTGQALPTTPKTSKKAAAGPYTSFLGG